MRSDIANYPAPVPPETWGMDDIFMRLVDAQEKLWFDKGYVWEWALELECTLDTTKEFDFIRRQSHVAIRDGDVRQRELKNAFRQYQTLKQEKRGINLRLAGETVDDLLRHYRDEGSRAELEKYLSHPKIKIKREDAILELEEFKANLRHKEKQHRRQAVANIMLARIHTFPQAQGGLSDLIEPRFGSYGYGYGWWDGDCVFEARIPPTGDAKTFIERYHVLLGEIARMAHEYGLVANFASGQLNFNVRRLCDGRNMMDARVMEDLDFHKRLLAGMQRMLDEAPHFKSDMRSTDNEREFFEFSARPSKSAGVHLRPERWEVRRSPNNGYLHMAKELAFWMTGASHTVFHVGDIDAYIETYGYPIRTGLFPDSFHEIHGQKSQLANLVAMSAVKDDGRLDPELGFIYDHHKGFLHEIGEHNHSLFTLSPEGDDNEILVNCTLASPSAWVALVEQHLSIDENNRIVVRGVHPEIADAFAPIVLERLRPIATSQPMAGIYGSATLFNALHLLTESPLLQAFLGDDDRARLREGYAGILTAQAKRQALEIAGGWQDDIRTIFDMAVQVHDSAGRLAGGMGQALDDEFKFDVMPFITSYSMIRLVYPAYYERVSVLAREKRQSNDENHSDDKAGTFCKTREELIAAPNRLRDQALTMAHDFREAAARLERENPGHNRLPILTEGFRRAAGYLENDIHDPRNYAAKIAEMQFLILKSLSDAGELDALDGLQAVDGIAHMLRHMTFNTFCDRRFSREDCIAIFRESLEKARAVFAKHANEVDATLLKGSCLLLEKTLGDSAKLETIEDVFAAYPDRAPE